MSQRNRLKGNLPAEFAAPLIDRSRPIRFSVDGIMLDAYEGDTVLSALLANGVISAGIQAGSAVALDAESAPPVTIEGGLDQMPMALCPVYGNGRFRTIGTRTKTVSLKRLLGRKRSSLDHDLDARRVPGGWIDAKPDETLETDVVIVGGGVAGMSAALAAAAENRRVVIIERDAVPGGVAVFFGKVEGETPPEDLIAGLGGELSKRPEITVLTRAEAFDMADGMLRAVQVVRDDGAPRPRNLAIRFSHVVLATGTEERLPIFPGNRLPGVAGAISAWRLARLFGVWIGETFHLHSATNAGYRLAILGSEAGKTVNRASDPRPDPRTRFIEFCKAYGFRLGWGARIGAAVPDRERLAINLTDHQFGGAENLPIRTDALIVSGGWQPALSLWLLAGGKVTWDAEGQRLMPAGTLERIALAGSAAGFTGTKACMQSGKAAIAALRGEAADISDPQISEIYESRDGPLAISPPETRRLPPAWLGPSRASALAEPPPRGIAALVLRQPPERAAHIRAADLLEALGLIASGQLPPAQADRYCRQWCVVPRAFRATGLPEPVVPASDDLPDYLIGRFGIGQAKWHLTPQEDRLFDPGCLIFINTDETHPRSAIGAIISGEERTCIALMARTEYGEGDTVYIRDGSTCTPARLTRKR